MDIIEWPEGRQYSLVTCLIYAGGLVSMSLLEFYVYEYTGIYITGYIFYYYMFLYSVKCVFCIMFYSVKFNKLLSFLYFYYHLGTL